MVEVLAKVLDATPDFFLCGSAPSLGEGLDAIRQIHPDLVLVDHSSGLKVVFQFIADVRNVSNKSQVVLWVQDMTEIDCFRALQIGARGIAKKTLPVPSLIECLTTVAKGDIWIESSLSTQVVGVMDRRAQPRLTPRERDIVRLICAGMKNKEIADNLSITAGTVKVHLMHIFEKTGVKDRFELAVHGRRLLGTDSSDESPKLATV
jgi:DNA-binding NarL/FixJ family response regulator